MLLRSPVWMLYSVPTISNKNANVEEKIEARFSRYVNLGKLGDILMNFWILHCSHVLCSQYGKADQLYKSRVVFLKLGFPSMRSPGIVKTEGLYSSNCKLQRCYHSSFQLFCAFFYMQLTTKAKYGLYLAQEKWHEPVSCKIVFRYMKDRVNTCLPNQANHLLFHHPRKTLCLGW